MTNEQSWQMLKTVTATKAFFRSALFSYSDIPMSVQTAQMIVVLLLILCSMIS